ncbi:MAG: hypothetical protein QMC51_09710, partial [Alteromonadaceae bacterium]
LPEAAKNLMHINKLRLRAQAVGISRIDAGPDGGVIEFSNETKVDPMFIIGLIKQQPRIYQMVGANKLKFKIETNNNQARFTLINNMLKELAER